MTRWGLVATIRAEPRAILDFAAWHLSLGAHRLHLYLDEDCPAARSVLDRHPRIRVRVTDAAYWKGKRPDTHQARQTRNATRCLRRQSDCDWIAHIDVDEFLLPGATPVADRLAALPDDALCARLRPVEALAPGPGIAPPDIAFKALASDMAARLADARALFPTWGVHLPGGFLSHQQGKLFVRASLAGAQFRIHNLYDGRQENPGLVPLPGCELGHFHAADPEQFLAARRFRLSRGSYRATLRPPRRQPGAPTLHELLTGIDSDGGEPRLRAFFDEMCTARPELIDGLAARGLLRRERMDFAALRQAHFPGSGIE